MKKQSRVKKVLSVGAISCLLGTLSLSVASAYNGVDGYDVNMDYSTGDPYDYSGILDKWLDEPAYVECTYGDYDFTATVLPGNRREVEHQNKKIYPGEYAYIDVPWFGNWRYDTAVLRGESNHDILYRVGGIWLSDPSRVE